MLSRHSNVVAGGDKGVARFISADDVDHFRLLDRQNYPSDRLKPAVDRKSFRIDHVAEPVTNSPAAVFFGSHRYSKMVGWRVLGGFQTQPTPPPSADGTNIFNLKIGARIAGGEGGPNSVYVGFGKALTGAVWYNELLRVEYRRAFRANGRLTRGPGPSDGAPSSATGKALAPQKPQWGYQPGNARRRDTPSSTHASDSFMSSATRALKRFVNCGSSTGCQASRTRSFAKAKKRRPLAFVRAIIAQKAEARITI